MRSVFAVLTAAILALAWLGPHDPAAPAGVAHRLAAESLPDGEHPLETGHFESAAAKRRPPCAACLLELAGHTLPPAAPEPFATPGSDRSTDPAHHPGARRRASRRPSSRAPPSRSAT